MTSDNNEETSPGRRWPAPCRKQKPREHEKQQVAARHSNQQETTTIHIRKMIRQQDHLNAKRKPPPTKRAAGKCCHSKSLMMMIIAAVLVAHLAASSTLTLASGGGGGGGSVAGREPQAKFPSSNQNNQMVNQIPRQTTSFVANQHQVNSNNNYHQTPSSHQLQALAQDINSQLSPSPKRSQPVESVPTLAPTSSVQGDSQPADDELGLESTSAASSELAGGHETPNVDETSSMAADEDETTSEEGAGGQPAEEEQPVEHQHSRRQLEVAAEVASTRRPPASRQATGAAQAATTMATFSVGADRMTVKPHEPIRIQFGPTTTASSSFGAPDAGELATESPNGALSDKSLVNERRQDLLYPSGSSISSQVHHQDSLARTINQPATSFDQSVARTGDPQQQQQQQPQPQDLPAVASICYTPLALLMIIIITMLLTCLVCFCTHYLIKYLGRRQFDLVANSKHFEHKHSSGYHLEGASNSRAHLGFSAAAAASPFTANQCDLGDRTRQQDDGNRANTNNKCLMHLFQPDANCNKCASGQRRHSMILMMGNNSNNNNNGSSPSEQQLLYLNSSNGSSSCRQQVDLNDADSCAFKNPYFAGDDSQARPQSLGYEPDNAIRASPLDGREAACEPSGLREVGQQRAQQRQQATMSAGLLQTANQRAHQQQEQLHFIEHHIANLHNRQVTSSVKELSILGNSPTDGSDVPLTAAIVDLTCEEQRARVINDPREGDLIAVDISGHDIIGLGFDVCGNKHEGIFVRSVCSHGPARESGCVEPGDRIKCLNISFEDVTLQDACALLNCGAPYKMRLLLEKRCLPAGLISKLNKLGARQAGPAAAKPGSPIKNAAKNYLKRLTNRVAGDHSAEQQQQQQQQHQQVANIAPPLGSLQARREMAQARGDLNQVNGDQLDESHCDAGHTNEAFGDDSSLADTGDHWRSQDQLTTATSSHLMSRRPSQRMRSASGRANDRRRQPGGGPCDKSSHKFMSSSGLDLRSVQSHSPSRSRRLSAPEKESQGEPIAGRVA